MTTTSSLGRTKTEHLNFNQRLCENGAAWDTLLTPPAYEELTHWSHFCLRPHTLALAPPRHVYYQLYYSDSSLQNWAWKRLENGQSAATCSGVFPAGLADRGIFEKEGFALYQVAMSVPGNTFATLYTDNKALSSCFVKGNSRNDYVNSLLGTVYADLAGKRSGMEVIWCNTDEMRETGADWLSRGEERELYTAFSLNNRGATLIVSVYGRIDYDLFSSPVNNVFVTRYFTKDVNQADPLCQQRDAFDVLADFRLEGNVFVFPPVGLTRGVVNILASLPETPKTTIILLIKACYFPVALQKLRRRRNFSSWRFQVFGGFDLVN